MVPFFGVAFVAFTRTSPVDEPPSEAELIGEPPRESELIDEDGALTESELIGEGGALMTSGAEAGTEDSSTEIFIYF